MTQTSQKQTTVHRSVETHPPAQQTFMDHIRELQSRLFYIALVFLLTAGAAYPFFTQISQWIVAPLGQQELVYLTPGGAFGFVIKVCMYVGFIATLPVVIYHLFQFLVPVMPSVRRKQLVVFTVSSLLLAIAGVAFAYFVSLPASLYFLTSFNIDNINPMLTIDSYFSFAMAYLVAGAILFQMPLLLMIIDSITPLTPKTLMTYQRHVILGSVIMAAIISPTPDVMNQMLLAGPLVLMYQAGICMVGVKHTRRSRLKRQSASKPVVVGRRLDYDIDEIVNDFKEDYASKSPTITQKSVVLTSMKANQVSHQESLIRSEPNVAPIMAVVPAQNRSVDGFRARRSHVTVPNRVVERHLRKLSVPSSPRRSLEGIFTPAPPSL